MREMDTKGIFDDDEVADLGRRVKSGLIQLPQGFTIATDPNGETIRKQQVLISRLALEKHELEQKLKTYEPALNGSINRMASDRGYE